jgi:hypothetical protein
MKAPNFYAEFTYSGPKSRYNEIMFLPYVVLVVSRLFEPILAPLLAERRAMLLVLAASALQVGLVATGLPAWPCPVKTFLGIPCPGCGLSTAVVYLLHGKWENGLRSHAFAPFFLFGFVLAAAISALPGDTRRQAVSGVARFEQRTGIVAFLLLGLVAYWVLRLLLRF